MLSVQLASRFLFYTGFHTKKTLRGTATDWYDLLCNHLKNSKAVRSWFAQNVLFNHPHRYCSCFFFIFPFSFFLFPFSYQNSKNYAKRRETSVYVRQVLGKKCKLLYLRNCSIDMIEIVQVKQTRPVLRYNMRF